MAFSGAVTALTSSIIGINQFDIKKIIAYSTCSQLGFMMLAVGSGNFMVAMYHLVNHAFFKALLFLCSGVIIHALRDEQDIRKMGGLINFFPLTYGAMLIGSLSLSGFPFLSGYYTKDLLIESLYSRTGYIIVALIACIAAFFTAFYSTRLLYLVFLGRGTNMNKENLTVIEEAPVCMAIPIVILTILSVISGFFTKEIFSAVSPAFRNSIYSHSSFVNLDNEFLLKFLWKLTPTICSFLGIVVFILTIVYYDFFYKVKLYLFPFYSLISKKFYFDAIYNKIFHTFIATLSYKISYKIIDRGILEVLGPTGIYNLFNRLANSFQKLHTGYIFHHIFYFLTAMGIIFLVVILVPVNVMGFVLVIKKIYFFNIIIGITLAVYLTTE
jgi:NADH-ubiquinone oxidoreductase chain 5